MEKLFTIIILALINVLEIILLLNTTMLQFELVAILFLLLLVFSMLFMLNQDYFWGMALFIFIINTINIAYLFLVFGGSYLLYMSSILVILGLVFSIFNLSKKPRVRLRRIPTPPKPKAIEIEKEIKGLEEEPNVIIEEYTLKPEKKPKEPVYKVKEVKKKYIPGKFIASKSSNKYHSPKCDWAKKIANKNRVWFESEAEAKHKGYSKHSCLENKRPKKS